MNMNWNSAFLAVNGDCQVYGFTVIRNSSNGTETQKIIEQTEQEFLNDVRLTCGAYSGMLKLLVPVSLPLVQLWFWRRYTIS